MRSAKRLKGLVLITVYLVIMTVTVFAASYIVAHAEDEDPNAPEETTQWYEISDNTLMIYLQDSTDEELEWKYSISDENLVKMTWSAHTGGEGYVAAFRPVGKASGKAIISYNLLRSYEEAPVVHKTIPVVVDENGAIKVVED